MNEMMNMSRRSVAKGAAWSVPAIAVIAGALAAASSAVYPPILCGTVPALSDTGLKSVAMTSGLLSTYDKAKSDVGMGAFFSANLGMWQFSKPASYITGYRVEIGDGGIDSATIQAHVRTASGVTTYANITTTGVGTAQVITAGITQNIAMQSPMPYRFVAKKAANYPVGFSIPFCVTWLAGLTATDISTEVNQCCFWLNYDTPASTDLFGNYPDSASVANSGDSYSVTINPKY